MIENSNVVCYLDKEKQTLTNGYINNELDGEFTLYIESEEESRIKKYFGDVVINGETPFQRFFITEKLIIMTGDVPKKEHTKYFVKFRIKKLILGGNCFDIGLLKFDKILCKFECLDQWCKGNNKFFIDFNKHIDSLSNNKCGASFIETFNIRDGMKLGIKVTGSELSNFQETIEVCLSKNEGTYNEYNSILGEFQLLLSLLLFKNVKVKDLYMMNGKHTMQVFQKNSSEEKYVYVNDIITYKQIEPYLPTILKNYFALPQDLKYMVSFLCAAINDLDNKFYISAFLNVTKAIEYMYNSDIANFKDEEESKRNEIKELINKENIDSKLKKELRNLLHAAYKVPFEKRLLTFFEDCQQFYDKTKLNKSKLVKEIVDSRNYYTHLDIKNKKPIYNQIKLHIVAYSLLNMAICKLLTYLNNNDQIRLDVGSFSRAKVFLNGLDILFDGEENYEI